MKKRTIKILVLTWALSFGAAIIGASFSNNSMGQAVAGWCTTC